MRDQFSSDFYRGSHDCSGFFCMLPWTGEFVLQPTVCNTSCFESAQILVNQMPRTRYSNNDRACTKQTEGRYLERRRGSWYQNTWVCCKYHVNIVFTSTYRIYTVYFVFGMYPFANIGICNVNTVYFVCRMCSFENINSDMSWCCVYADSAKEVLFYNKTMVCYQSLGSFFVCWWLIELFFRICRGTIAPRWTLGGARIRTTLFRLRDAWLFRGQ